jgi:hypothetical protein
MIFNCLFLPILDKNDLGLDPDLVKSLVPDPDSMHLEPDHL